MKTNLLLQKSNIHPLLSYTKTMVSRFSLFLMGCLLFMQAKSQTDKRLAMADQYFASGDYFTAAGLYAQFLHPAVKPKTRSEFPLTARRNTDGKMGIYSNKTDIIFKQAECYRLANDWTDAATLYKACVEKDSAKYATALYWYIVCQRSMGNYVAAEETIDRFVNNYGKASPFYQDVMNEKQTIQFVKAQLARPDSVLYHTEKLNTALGNSKGIFAPVAVMDNQLMFTSTQTRSVSEGINPYQNRLFYSMLTSEGLQDIEPVMFESVDSSLNQGAASVSPDGGHLYLTQWKKENGHLLSSIYFSAKTSNGWSEPKLLSRVNEQGHSSKQPFCSANGRYLFFASDRKGGKGGFDIWYAPLNDDGTAGEPVNAGPVINTPANEQAPFYHSSTGTLVFASDRTPGMGGYDLFASKGSPVVWKAPENMGYPINSSRDDVYFFAAENSNLLKNAIVSSDRGSECCLATYTITKTAKKRMITGIIQDCSGNGPLADAEVIFRNAQGSTLKATTTSDGKYSFELSDTAGTHQLSVAKEKYNEKTADVVVENVNESNWQTDTVYNAAFCLERKIVLKVENVVTVYFDFDKSIVNTRAAAQLDSIYTILMENPGFTIQVSGYTDGKGTVGYNRKLSDRRSKACADYLISKGMDTARVSFASFGACCPVEMELINGRDNAQGRSKNRRALINIAKE